MTQARAKSNPSLTDHLGLTVRHFNIIRKASMRVSVPQWTGVSFPGSSNKVLPGSILHVISTNSGTMCGGNIFPKNAGRFSFSTSRSSIALPVISRRVSQTSFDEYLVGPWSSVTQGSLDGTMSVERACEAQKAPMSLTDTWLRC